MDRKFAGRIIVMTVFLFIVASCTAFAEDSLNFKEADLRDVLHTLGRLANVNIAADPQVQGTVTMFLQGLAPLDAIDLVVRTHGYDYLWVENTLVVGPSDTLSAGFKPTTAVFFPLQYVEANEIAPILSLVVQPATVQPDSVHKGVLVRGTEEQLARARRFLAERDSKRELEFDFQDADLLTVFRTLARQGGYSLLLDSPLHGTLTILLQGVDIDEAIELAARQSGVNYRFEGNSLIVSMDPPSAITAAQSFGPRRRQQGEEQSLQLRVFPLYYIEPAGAKAIIAGFSPDIRLEVTEIENSLFVRGTRDALQQVEQLLNRFDVPQVRLDGIVVQADERLAVLTIGTRTYVVTQGERVSAVDVVDVGDGRVVLRTARGHMMHVAIGGGE